MAEVIALRLPNVSIWPSGLGFAWSGLGSKMQTANRGLWQTDGTAIVIGLYMKEQEKAQMRDAEGEDNG